MRIELQAAFVLHHKAYRNSSLLLDILTRDYGRIGLVAKGVRATRRAEQHKRALLQPFRALLVSYSGKSELQTLIGVESQQQMFVLQGKALFSGFYINELLMRLMHQHDPHENLFDLYRDTLQALQNGLSIEPLLRRFEYALLQELGYGIPLACDGISHEAILGNQCYRYDVDHGFILQATFTSESEVFSGRCLQAMSGQQFDHPEYSKDMKRLMRLVLSRYLGSKPLKSRELFC